MAKETVAYYESLQEFRIAESQDGDVIGCGALHVMWEDLAEIRTLAAADTWRGRGVGHVLVEDLLEKAKELGVSRVPWPFRAVALPAHAPHPVPATCPRRDEY